jgi:uncharacterized membrane protein YfcA
MITEQNKVMIQDAVLAIAVLILLVMAALPIFNINWELARYVYAGGAVLALLERLTEKYEGKNLRIRRLYRIGKVSAALYCVSAALLFYHIPTDNGRDWIGFLMAGAVLQIYASFVIQHEEKKEQETNVNGKATK